MINVKIKLVEPFATMPTKAHDTDACFDLYAPIGAYKSKQASVSCALVGIVANGSTNLIFTLIIDLPPHDAAGHRSPQSCYQVPSHH